jgi:hypothetical protein
MSIDRIYGPLEHYDYGVLDRHCLCDLCLEWRAAQRTWHEYQDNKRKNPQDRIAHRSTYLAAVSRRDLYCESSWHASENRWGEDYMDWISRQITETAERSKYWWRTEGLSSPLLYWFRQFNVYRRSNATAAFDPPLIDLRGA